MGRTGIFGGTFNPIHLGHLRVAEEVREIARLDRILFIPAGHPPLKDRDVAPIEERLAMTRAATSANPLFSVSDIEAEPGTPSFTVTTLRRIVSSHPEERWWFILGVDAFADLPKWREPDALIRLIDFVIVTRPGYPPEELLGSPFVTDKVLRTEGEVIHLELKGGREALVAQVSPIWISSTDIRRRVAEGLSIQYLVPEPVRAHIEARGLYRRSTTGPRA